MCVYYMYKYICINVYRPPYIDAIWGKGSFLVSLDCKPLVEFMENIG